MSVGLLATAGTVFVAGMSLSTGVEAVAEEQKQQRTWDVDVQLASPATENRIDRIVERVPDVAAIEGFNVAPAGVAGPGEIPVTRTYPDQGHGRVAVTAVPAGAITFPRPTMLEGRWLESGETGAIVLNQVARKNTVPGVHPDDTLQLIVGGKVTSWRVVGIAQERQSHGSGVYTTSEGLAEAMEGPPLVNQLRIFTSNHDEQTREQVAVAVEDRLTDAGIKVSSAASITRSEGISEGHLGPVVLILIGVAIPLGVVGVIGLASTMSANVLDRTREFGVMHAIGARPKAVRRIVVAEGIFLAITSCVVAVLPALALTSVLGVGLGNLFFSAPLPFRVSLFAILIWSYSPCLELYSRPTRRRAAPRVSRFAKLLSTCDTTRGAKGACCDDCRQRSRPKHPAQDDRPISSHRGRWGSGLWGSGARSRRPNGARETPTVSQASRSPRKEGVHRRGVTPEPGVLAAFAMSLQAIRSHS
jgi:putative ABC transport system permease protein